METGEREVEEVVEGPEVDEVAQDDSGGEGEVKNESARETVERVLREASKEDGTGSKNVKPEKHPGTTKEAKGPTSVRQTPPAEDVKPLGRLTVPQREVFNKLPPPLKTAYNEMIRSHEQKFTEVTSKAAQKEKDAQHVIETVRPYLLAHPELQEAGFTESKLVSSLVATHQRLTNPQTSISEYVKIGKGLGIPDEVLQQISGASGQKGGQPVNISQHPEFRALQDELNRIKSEVDGRKTQEVNSTVSRILSEMETVREEKDGNGKYLYPELFDDAFLDRVKPLVSALVGADPKLSYGEALKRARNTLLGVPGYSNQQSQTRLPAGSANNNRATAAAVSVRGRVSAPLVPGEVQDIPPEALGSARDTVAWALKQMRRGA